MNNEPLSAFTAVIASILFLIGIAPSVFELTKRSLIAWHKMKSQVRIYKMKSEREVELEKIEVK